MQIIEYVILALLAAVVLYQLYAVLGRKVGRQPTPAAETPMRPPPQPGAAAPLQSDEPSGLSDLRQRDPAFDPSKFLQGAQIAYETIVRAFAAGDRNELKGLVSTAAMPSFDASIAQREAEGRTEKVEFQHTPRADIQSAVVDGRTARVQVRFLAEFRSRTKGPEGEAVDDRRTADLWTFERELGASDPNWILARVDAAEA